MWPTTPPLWFPYGCWWVLCSLQAHQLFWLWPGSFVCHWHVSLSNMLWQWPLWRLFKGGNVNKEQIWRVRPTQSVTWLPFHLSNSHLIWIWCSILCPNLPIMYPLLQQGLTAREGNLFTILHFTSLLRAGVTERGAAWAAVKYNVHLARFNGQDMATVNSAISADWELIVYCTEADPISHCRKNTFSVFVCGWHGCQRGEVTVSCLRILHRKINTSSNKHVR